MAYFLKRSNIKKGTYLQIYESFYDPARKQTAHRSVRAIGYVHELREQGIEDPIAHFKAQVDAMNADSKAERRKSAEATRIGDSSPALNLGHFPLRALDAALGIGKEMSWLQIASGLKAPLFELLSSLVYARAVDPGSKLRTYSEVLPRVNGCASGYSLDQLYDALAFLGVEYEKVIEIYNHAIGHIWTRDISRAYFDCTNFFFEIDAEDALRKKGPSKENRKDPIVGLGLLLDADCLPLGMSIYPGNESEKPVIREVVSAMKTRHPGCGRTVRVADKGLNCADNIADALLCGDGYIFSKSVKQLPEAELDWALSEEGFADAIGSDGQLAYRIKSIIDEFDYQVTDENGKRKKVSLKEKRIVTYNPKLARKHDREISRMVEKARGLRLSEAKRSEYGESAKFVTFTTVDADGCEGSESVACSLNHEAIAKARRLAGYNMIVTSEVNMEDDEIYSTYHNLWRIEESFRVMKSQLDARPVYLQREETIKGHFLVCYISVLLLRLLQIKVLGDEFGSEEIIRFIRGFDAVPASDRRYINLSRRSVVGDALERKTGLPINNYYLSKAHVDKIRGFKFDEESLS